MKTKLYRHVTDSIIWLCFGAVMMNSMGLGEAADDLKDGSSLVCKLEFAETVAGKPLPTGVSLRDAGMPYSSLVIDPAADGASDFLLMEIDKPGVKQAAYMITGQVRYEGVEPAGYLEMLNKFGKPFEGEYFTRSLDESGPMGKLIGSSPWREFQLPFFINQKGDLHPERLRLRVHLPGKGHVELKGLELREMPLPAAMKSNAAGASAKPAGESEPIGKVHWKELAEAGKLPAAATVVQDGDQSSVVKIERSATSPQLIELAVIDNPAIKAKQYMLRGRIRYDGVEGTGFVEMWNMFPEPKKGAYFSRTMAPHGPMGNLQGTSPWRDLQLPFFINQADFPAPERLKINVFLPGKGTVWVSDLELVELPDSAAAGFGISNRGSLVIWGIVTIGTIVVLAVLVAGLIATITKSKVRGASTGEELRRMQAMDIS